MTEPRFTDVPDGSYSLFKKVDGNWVGADVKDDDEITLHGKLYVLKAKDA